MNLFRTTFIVLGSCLWLIASNPSGNVASGQEVKVVGPDGKPMAVPAGAVNGMPVPGQPPGAPQMGPDGKPIDKTKKAEKKEGDTTAEANTGPPVTKRPTEPATKPDPKELEVRLDPNGRVAFSFRNQPWPQLLEWLAEISGEPLDWQELPGDFVNLASPRAYTVLETQDLFNRHLLARGYTMLRLDGGLAVVKAADLNPALVPAVTSSELATLPAYQFVRTVFDLDWLPAEKIATELKPMISAAGKLVPLAATNRIEAMDAVANLRRIGELLADEQSSAARDRLAREFPLRSIPAAQAKTMLSDFLGLNQQSKSVMDPRQLQQMMQMMQQQGGGGERPDKAAQPKKEPEISIVASERNNSLIVQAPADRMAIAAEFIKRIDVPSSDIGSLADMQTRLQTFRLTSLDPEKLQEMLLKMNVLEPTTRLTVDAENQALVVYGSAPDRFVVEQLVKRLDGTARQFAVIQLRRLDPRDVAESINFLMGIDPEKKEDSNRNRYSYFSYGFDRNDSKKKKEDAFRVAANVQNRQVMLWASEIELKEVNSLLVKLGELPPDNGLGSRMRVIDASNTAETYEYLERLQKQLQRTSPHRLTLPPKEKFNKETDIKPVEDAEENAKPDHKPAPALDKAKAPVASTTSKTVFASNRGPVDGSPSEEPPPDEIPVESTAAPDPKAVAEKKPPSADPDVPPIRSRADFDRAFGNAPADKRPSEAGKGAEIRIELDASGNLVLMSDDTEALNQIENMMLQTPPPRRPYVVFHIKYGPAAWIRGNLEDYFKDLVEKKDREPDSQDRFYRYIFDIPDDSKKPRLGLGEAQKLRFISDSTAGTIVVTGASERNLEVIEELIRLWDVPEPSNVKNSRFTKLVQVKYSKASTIAETLKEAYRDLLSANDKAFVAPKKDGGGGGEDSRSGSGSGMTDSKSGQNSGKTSFSFKGDLSFGVDDLGNTLLISAKGQELLSLVIEMIEQLDEAARPSSTVEVIPSNGSKSMERALRALLDANNNSFSGSSRGSDSRDSRR